MPRHDQHWLNYIAGDWRDSDHGIDVIDPASGEVFADIAHSRPHDLDDAVAAARACVDSGALYDPPPKVRRRWLLGLAEALEALMADGIPLLVRENGKTQHHAKLEFDMAVDYLRYYAGMADKLEGRSIPLGNGYVDYTVHEPIGVSAQIVPWNFPIDIAARSLAPALAAGCPVVMKSPEHTPLAITLFGAAADRAGLPPGAFSLLAGHGATTGAALASHPDIDQITFTGSVTTGQSILRAAAARTVPCTMELGGKSAAVVFADADLDRFMDDVQWGIYFNAGQTCSALARIIVARPIYSALLTRLKAQAANQRLAPGMTTVRDAPHLTPLISAAQRDRVLALCAQARAQGARVICGGQAHDDLPGYFMQPTVFADVTPDMAIFQQEVFGPVITVTPFDTAEQAWQLANATDYGLVAGVFTRDVTQALRAGQRLKAGQVFVNEWFAGGIETPFGGIKRSGFGREKGLEALYTYLNTKNVGIRLI